MDSSATAERRESVVFVNGIQLVPVTHVSVLMKDLYGAPLLQSISKWDISEFLQNEFSDPIIDLAISSE